MFRTLPSPKSLWAPASEGFGYFQGGPGPRFGPGCCFKLQAKLGFSTTPSMTPRVRCYFIFVYPGIDDGKEFLCLVTELFSCSIQDTLEALQGEFIPVPSVKRILRHVLLGIARLHKCGIVHTGLMQCKLARRY
jgi:serine/threonine-protein kinase SRPK3